MVSLLGCKLWVGFSMASMIMIAGCRLVDSSGLNQTYKEGYVFDQNTLSLISVGSSQEQIMLTLGTPSLKTEYNNNEVFYYISQVRYRGVQFMKAKIVDRKILAIYFDKDKQVTKIANYGLQDGQIFDFISRTTPAAKAEEQPFLTKIIKDL
ncbi:outer membrane protein assembly factor BamE [Bartonella sp. B41]